MTARAQVMAAVVRVSGPPDVIELKKVERPTAGYEVATRLRIEFEPADNGDRGGKPFLIRFFREMR